LRKLAIGAAFCALLGVLAETTKATGRISNALDRTNLTSAYSGNPDLVTAYATEMARYRLELLSRHDRDNLARVLGPRLLRPEFRAWTWRAGNGSLLQGFAGQGGFRLTLGNCLALFCASSECSYDAWPVFKCSDGQKRKMVVKDFETAIFDGIPYRRLSAPAAQVQGG
jgi:hypothetical protein